MDPRKTPLFANLDRALRRAYDRPLEHEADTPDGVVAFEDDAAVPERIGRYRVRGVIARGGMGAVLRAEDPELGRDVAIKVSRSRDAALLELFANEARICSQLQHPGIVPVYERGRTDDARPYYVMKLIEGETFATLLGARPSPRSDAGRMLEIFTAVCQTMAYVHSRGFFHGDLKPGNIMVGAFGEVQVMDWGIAGGDVPDARGASDPAAKKPPLAVGTPAYMPPERARGDRNLTGVRSDVFSLGAILCEILIGDPPYRGSHRSEIFRKAVNAELADALQALAASGADAALVAIARDCLAVDPEARPADAEAVAHRIADHVDAVGQRARDAEIELARAHARHASERRARRLTLALAAAVILGLLAGGAGFLLLRDEKMTRQADAARVVDEAIVAAHQGLAEAKVSQPPDPERWANAEALAVRAVALAERSSADQGTIARARALQAETHTLRSNRLRHLAFQDRIEDIEHHGLEEDRAPEWLDAAYRSAFHEAGIDPAKIDAELIADDAARASLSLALARWALARGRSPAEPTRKDLLHAALVVDPDPDRKNLCSAYLAGDHETLLQAGRSQDGLGSSPESLFLLSRFLLTLGHREESTAVLRAACARHPGDFRVHHDLAARLGTEALPNYDEIIRLLSMCVATRPSSAHALIDLGGAYHASEQLELAAAALEKATAIQPSHSRGWIVLATVRKDMGELDLAKQAAEAAVRCETDPDTLLRMATHFWARSLTDATSAALRKSIEIRPGEAPARVELGKVALYEGDYETAIAQLREAVEIAPSTAGTWYALGLALAATMNVEDARDAFEKAIELGEPSVDVAVKLAGVLLVEGSTERALQSAAMARERLASRRVADPVTAEWLSYARKAAELASPADAATAPERAHAAFLRGWFRTSASLFEEWMTTTELSRAGRIEAARAAAFAGRGLSSEADAAGPESRPGLRASALARLRIELGELRKEWGADHLQAPAIRRVLRSWIADPAFPSARLKDFAALPPGEREAWEGFWKDVGTLLADLDELVLPPGVTLQRAFSAQSLGVPGPLAGVQFGSDGRTLYLIGNAGFKASSIYALEVERDAATHAITGFGPPRMRSRAEHADGGLTQVADGTFYWSTWREHELGELPAKGSAKRFPLAASGVPAGGGGLAFVPAGTSAGALLMSGYADGGIYSVSLSEPIDGARTPIPDSAKLVARLPKGIEGIRFVPGGPLAGSLLVANWDAGAVSLVEVDRKTGLPVVDAENRASPRNFLGGMVGASGLDFDPLSGALVVSGWGSGNRLVVLAGVGNPPK